jgi:hypothetical protein
MKYYVKRTGEAFHFEATFEQIQIGLKTGEIQPDWGVRKETDGDYDWIYVHELRAPETEPSNQVSSTTEFLTPKPSYGVFVWAGFILLVAYSTISHLLEDVEHLNIVGTFFIFLVVLCGVMSVAVCIWWHFVSKKRARKLGVLRGVLGCIAFAFGTILPLSAAMLIPLGFAKKSSFIIIGAQFIIFLAIATGLIAGAYHLVFQRDEKTVT